MPVVGVSAGEYEGEYVYGADEYGVAVAGVVVVAGSDADAFWLLLPQPPTTTTAPMRTGTPADNDRRGRCCLLRPIEIAAFPTEG